jgi:membrane protein implicated in regulation of membrane protease activity
MEVTNELLWLAAGVILVLLEFTLLPAVGMLFAGIAALVVGILMEAGIITGIETPWIIFLGTTVMLAALFYKPLKNFRTNKNSEYKDMVGEEVNLLEDLEIGKNGNVKWSGTTMKARLCPDCKTGAKAGVSAKIIGLDGNILIIKP